MVVFVVKIFYLNNGPLTCYLISYPVTLFMFLEFTSGAIQKQRQDIRFALLFKYEVTLLVIFMQLQGKCTI